MNDYLFIHEWDDHQTYRKDRGTPPWIKVYRKLLTSQKWSKLSDSEKGQLVSLWIIAADENGKIPSCPKILRKVAQLDEEPNINRFIELGFIYVNVNQMSTKCQPNDAPETETETETETDRNSQKYFFQGGSFNITHKDKDRWIESYSTFDEKSLKSELQKLDDYYKSKGENKNLFHRVSACIAKANEDRNKKGVKPSSKIITARDLEGAYDVN